MSEQPTSNGTSFRSKLDQYWVKRSIKPAVIPNERLLSVSHEHWIKYVFPSFLYVVLMGASVLLFYFAALTTPSVLGVSLFLFTLALLLLFVTHHWFFWFLLAESQAHIIVTNKRVIHIHESLLWREEMVEVSFEKMKTVEAHKKNIFQSVLNYGTLQFEPMVKFRLVSHPGTLARQIEQAMGMI